MNDEGKCARFSSVASFSSSLKIQVVGCIVSRWMVLRDWSAATAARHGRKPARKSRERQDGKRNPARQHGPYGVCPGLSKLSHPIHTPSAFLSAKRFSWFSMSTSLPSPSHPSPRSGIRDIRVAPLLPPALVPPAGRKLSRVVQIVSPHPRSKRSCPRSGFQGFQCRKQLSEIVVIVRHPLCFPCFVLPVVPFVSPKPFRTIISIITTPLVAGFQEVLPALDVRQIQWLRQEMRKAGVRYAPADGQTRPDGICPLRTSIDKPIDKCQGSWRGRKAGFSRESPSPGRGIDNSPIAN